VRFEAKDGWIVLDQIRAVDKHRMIKRLGSLKEKEILNIKNILKEMLVD
jgi:mRNA interferase MazF